MHRIYKRLKIFILLRLRRLNPPLFKYAYLMHFNTRTAEEFVQKIKRRYPPNKFLQLNDKIKTFFTINKFTEEKLQFFEKSFNK